MKKLIVLSLILISNAHALVPRTTDNSNTNFQKAVSNEKTISSCSSERIDVTRLVKTKFVRSSRMRLKTFSMLPTPHGLYHELIKDLDKNHLTLESANAALNTGKDLLAGNCEIYFRKIERNYLDEYGTSPKYVVYNSCKDGSRESLPKSTQKWLEFVDANCEM